MPSSVASRRMTIGRAMFGSSAVLASGSSCGMTRICERMRDIFMLRSPLRNAVAIDRRLVEAEPETGRARHDELAVLGPRHRFEEAHQPRHVFDRQPVWHRPDQMDVNF